MRLSVVMDKLAEARDDRVESTSLPIRRFPSWSAFIIVLTVLFCVAEPRDAGAQGMSPIQKGKEIATKLCARCHSIDLDSDSPFADAPPFRTFAKKWPIESLEEALAEGIMVGHPAMPEFVLAPQEIDSLLSYMGSLSR